ncbi:hypothetical protein Q2T41_14415 [Maribacter confluentis]|uniref:TolC family protein n=1 Tax=Maribacter confluentis TaxID=1656093 RepID=A0ABT8RSF1_9FLAO|nr:hypothetical protein [Maribacter confluentis]MDO1513851.1 hypothetical protein [Maribacter confluentis]
MAKAYAENSLAIAEQLNILDNQQQNLQLLYDINKTVIQQVPWTI